MAFWNGPKKFIFFVCLSLVFTLISSPKSKRGKQMLPLALSAPTRAEKNPPSFNFSRVWVCLSRRLISPPGLSLFGAKTRFLSVPIKTSFSWLSHETMQQLMAKRSVNTAVNSIRVEKTRERRKKKKHPDMCAACCSRKWGLQLTLLLRLDPILGTLLLAAD